MSEGELVDGRYRIEPAVDRHAPRIARDLETGERVVLPAVGFIAEPLLRAAAERLSALADPRLSPILSCAPVAIACPDAWRADTRVRDWAPLAFSVVEAVDAMLEVVELGSIASLHGAWVSWSDAWFDRDASGKARGRLVAPVGASRAGYFDARWLAFGLRNLLGGRDRVTGLRYPRGTTDEPPVALVQLIDTWLSAPHGFDDRVPPSLPSIDTFVSGLRPFSSDPSRAWEAPRAPSRPFPTPLTGPDLDFAIRLGEDSLAPHRTASVDAWTRARRDREGRFALAWLIHRRACFALGHGEIAGALADAERALELDGHPEYFTTLALIHERCGDRAAAASAHDRACAAIEQLAPQPAHFDVDRPIGDDPPDRDYDFRPSWPAKAARSLHARGAFRARNGDRAGAREDLLASLATHPTDAARRALARASADADAG